MIETFYSVSVSTASRLQSGFGLVLPRNDHLPDYQVEYDEETDQVVFRNRAEWWEKHQQRDPPPFRSLDTFEKAKRYTMGEDCLRVA